MDKIIDTSYFKNNFYNSLNKSSLTPPPKVFSIVWTILYALMVYSFYVIYKKDKSKLKFFYLQIIINILWVIVFFTFNSYKLSLVLLIVLIYLVYKMYITFKEVDKTIGLLQLPYLCWLCVALYLNGYIYFNN